MGSMGYSLKVEARSAALRDEMVSFVRANCKSLGDAADLPEAHGKRKIAIHYSSCLYGPDRVRVFSVARWMALKIGSLASRFDREVVRPNRFDSPVPFIVYDSCERWPVLACSSEKDAMSKWPESLWWCATDPLGAYLGERTSGAFVSALALKIFEDPEKAKLHAEALSALGECPKNDSVRWNAWLKGKKRAEARILAPEIRDLRKSVDAELRLLDSLWRDGARWSAGLKVDPP